MMIGRSPVLYVVAAIFLAACSEPPEDARVRQAVAPILQRHLVIHHDVAHLSSGAPVNDESGHIKASEALGLASARLDSAEREIRLIVPTKRYACLLTIATRLFEADVRRLRAASAYRRSLAGAARGERGLNDAVATVGDGDGLAAALREIAAFQSERARPYQDSLHLAANEETRVAAALGDSLAALEITNEVIPGYQPVRYFLLKRDGTDSTAVKSPSHTSNACRG